MLLAKIIMAKSNTKQESFILRILEIMISEKSGVQITYELFIAVEYFNNRQQNTYKKITEYTVSFDNGADAYNNIQKALSNFEILLRYAKTGFLTVYSSSEEGGKIVDNIEEIYEKDPDAYRFKDFKVGDFDLNVIGGSDVLDRYHIQESI